MALQVDGLEFLALEDSIETRATESRMLYLFLASPVVFEQDRRREWRHRRQVAARNWDWRRGQPPGCPKQATELLCAGRLLVPEIAHMAGMDKSTVYRYLRPDGTP